MKDDGAGETRGEQMRRRVALAVAALVSLAVAGTAVPAQAALPPGSPGCGANVGSSMRLISDVGSQGTPCTGDGLVITASNVTLDLNGHTIWGGGGSDAGVSASGPDAIRVLRGTIRGFGGSGVELFNSTGSRVGGVTLAQNGTGVTVIGDGFKASGDVVTSTASGSGFAIVGNDAVISGNTVFNTATGGIRVAGIRSTIANNTVSDSGSIGIELAIGPNGASGAITGNAVTSSGQDGIDAVGRAAITQNTVTESTGHGIEMSGGTATTVSNISGNATYDNTQDGIHVAQSNPTVKRNRASGNGNDGIEIAGNNAVVTNNRTHDNPNDGIAIPGNSPVLTGNRMSGNGVDGVGVIGNNARFSNNNSSANGDDGFHVIGTGERFVENVAKGNGYPATAGVGLGINAPGATGRDNIAQGNDDPTECNPTAIC